MAFIPVPNTIRCVIGYTWGGQEVANDLYFTKATAVEHQDLLNLGGGLDYWMHQTWMVILNVALVYYHIVLTDLTTEDGESYDWQVATPVPGSIAGVCVPLNVAAVLTFRTPLRGRSYRGRFYIAGMPNSMLLDIGHLTGNAMTSILAAFAEIEDVEGSTNLTHSVVSRRHNLQWRTTGVSTAITAYTIDSALDSQRRRLPGRGE